MAMASKMDFIRCPAPSVCSSPAARRNGFSKKLVGCGNKLLQQILFIPKAPAGWDFLVLTGFGMFLGSWTRKQTCCSVFSLQQEHDDNDDSKQCRSSTSSPLPALLWSTSSLNHLSPRSTIRVTISYTPRKHITNISETVWIYHINYHIIGRITNYHTFIDYLLDPFRLFRPNIPSSPGWRAVVRLSHAVGRVAVDTPAARLPLL